MGRRKSADPRTTTLGVKVTKGKASAVDTVRGAVPRANWLEKLIDAALEAEGISSAPLDSLPPQIPAVKTRTRGHRVVNPPGPPKAKIPPPPPPARPPGAAIFQDPGGEPIVADAPPAPASARKRCMHPGTRSIGGWCPPCGHLIESGGCWSAACEAGTCVHPK